MENGGFHISLKTTKMITRNTLQEDVLDILFANRNKAYGAYALRRNYPDRLRKSIGLMLGSVTLLSAVVVWIGARTVGGYLPPSDPGISVILQPPPGQPIQHPRVLPRPVPTPKPAAVLPAATTPYTPPLLVDKLDPSKDPPDLSVLEHMQVGVSPGKGDPSGVGTGPAPATSGTATAKGDDEKVLDGIVERMPVFPGGEEALRRFFMRYLQFPDDAEGADQVRVVIRFVVGKDGGLSAYAVQQTGGQLFDTEVIRVLKKMPKWTPGIQNGHPVSVYFNLPVTFMRPGN
jgi:periplasmic protein TonB